MMTSEYGSPLHGHEHEVVGPSLHGRDSLLTVARHVGVHADLFEHAQRDLAVHRLIVHQQYARSTVLGHQQGLGVAGVGHAPADSVRVALEPGGEPEGAALAGHAAGTGVAAHHLSQLARDGQAQASAAVLAGGRVVGLLEGAKQPRQFVGRNAYAGVDHLETQQHPVVGRGCATLRRRLCRGGRIATRVALDTVVGGVDLAHPQGHAALLGELDGIGDVVEQRLLEPRGVAAQLRRQCQDLGAQHQAT